MICVTISQTIAPIPIAEADAPMFDHGETEDKPMPVHNASRISDKAAKEAQTIVLSCTGWPTYDLIGTLRRWLGRPVISSNLAIVMHALRPDGEA